MKKLIYGGLFIALVGIAFVGCDKESIADNTGGVVDNQSEKYYVNKNSFTYATPNNISELPSFFGQLHNDILEDCIFENPISGLSEVNDRFNNIYNDYAAFDIEIGEQKTMNMVSSTNSENIEQTILEIKNDIVNNINIDSTNKEYFNQYFNIISNYLIDDDGASFHSSLSALETSILNSPTVMSSPNLDDVEKSTFILISSIGIAKYSNDFWVNAYSSGALPIDTNDPAPVAPWVASDAVGGVLGVYGNILADVATGSETTWSGYATSFLWGAATNSLGGFIKWW
jgi:hypothetical protein